MQYWSIKTSSLQEQVYILQQSSSTVSKQIITNQKTYSWPDNKCADNMNEGLLETAEKRICIGPGDTWANQVKGSLISMENSVAEEALLHKRCNTNFSRGSSFNTDGAGGRTQDGFRLGLFDKRFTRLETELERSLFTLEQIHEKVISMDKSPDSSYLYSNKELYEKTKYGSKQISGVNPANTRRPEDVP